MTDDRYRRLSVPIRPRSTKLSEQRKCTGSLFSPHDPLIFSFERKPNGLPLRMSSKFTCVPSKLARYLSGDGG